MEIKSIEEQGRIILEISGRIDTTTAGSFEKQVLQHFPDSGEEIVLDCERIEYISSAGLRSLLILARTASGRHMHISLCRVPELVREVLEISGFDSFFEVRHERNG